MHWTLHKPECKSAISTNSNATTPSTIESAKKLTPSASLSSSSIASTIKQIPQTATKSSSVTQPGPNSMSLYSVRDYDMNIDDYTITGSPAIFKLSQDDIVDRETIQKYADILVLSMLNEGYCVIDNFLGETNSGKVLWDVTNICRSGIMKPGQIISKSKNMTQKKIRGDIITWVTGQEEAYENMKLIMNQVDRLIRYCHGKLGDIKGRTPVSMIYYIL